MDPEIRDLLERLGELTDEEIGALEERLLEEFEDAEAAPVSAETVATMGELAAAIASVRAAKDERSAQAQQLAEDAAAIAAQVRGEPEAEGDETTPEVPEEPEVPAETEPEVPAETEPEAVAAGLTPLERLNRRRPAGQTPRRRARSSSLVAAADVPGLPAGAPINNAADLGQAFVRRWDALRGGRVDGRVPVASVRVAYPEERTLGPNYAENHERIRAVTNMDAIVAAGGLCAPVDVRYDLTVVSVPDRPVRDALARFGATRGGIRFIAPPHLSEMPNAVDIITEAQDTANATKPCLTVVCGTEQEVLVSAVTRCLRFGNFNAKFFPEMVDSHMALVLAEWAREADQQLLNLISTGSTAVTAATQLGTYRDVMADVDRAAAGYRGRHRMAVDTPLRLLAPQWLRNNMRTDLVRQLPGDDTYGRAEQIIADGFRTRFINVSWTLEGRNADQTMSGAQAAGGLNPWPSTVDLYLFHEGAWLFLDGGTLDLGLVRDSTLNLANDFQMFAETFEAAALIGVESLRINVDVCPDGSSSATVDISPCTTGS